MDSRSIIEVIVPVISHRNFKNKKTVNPFITKVFLKKRDLLEKMLDPFSLQNEEYLAATSRHLSLSEFSMCNLVRLSNFKKMVFLTDHHIAGDKITSWVSSKAPKSKISENFGNLWVFIAKVFFKTFKTMIFIADFVEMISLQKHAKISNGCSNRCKILRRG